MLHTEPNDCGPVHVTDFGGVGGDAGLFDWRLSRNVRPSWYCAVIGDGDTVPPPDTV